MPKHLRYGLISFIYSLRLPDPNTLPPRPDGLPCHPHLTSHTGVACRYCEYRTTSLELLVRHLAKAYNCRRGGRRKGWLRNEIIQDLRLQSWSQNGARGYWIAAAPPEWVAGRGILAAAGLRNIGIRC